MNVELMKEAFPQILAGVPDTLLLVFSSLALGVVLAVVLAQMRLSSSRVLATVAVVAVGAVIALVGSIVVLWRSDPPAWIAWPVRALIPVSLVVVALLARMAFALFRPR